MRQCLAGIHELDPEGRLRPDRTSLLKGSGLLIKVAAVANRFRTAAKRPRPAKVEAGRLERPGLTAFSLPFAEPHARASAAVFINKHNTSGF